MSDSLKNKLFPELDLFYNLISNPNTLDTLQSTIDAASIDLVSG